MLLALFFRIRVGVCVCVFPALRPLAVCAVSSMVQLVQAFAVACSRGNFEWRAVVHPCERFSMLATVLFPVGALSAWALRLRLLLRLTWALLRRFEPSGCGWPRRCGPSAHHVRTTCAGLAQGSGCIHLNIATCKWRCFHFCILVLKKKCFKWWQSGFLLRSPAQGAHHFLRPLHPGDWPTRRLAGTEKGL